MGQVKKNIIGIIIEVRSTSSRLPNKHFYKINNKPILELMINRVKKIKGIDKIILATTKNKEDDKICKLAKKKKINYFRGSENNVTQRVLQSAKKFRLKTVCTITGDCPIIDINLVNQLISTFLDNFSKKIMLEIRMDYQMVWVVKFLKRKLLKNHIHKLKII